MKMRIVPLLVLPLVLTGVFAGPAPAGEEARTVPLCSDRKGNAGWVELDRADGRMQATPYLRISGETVRGALETAGRAGEARVSAATDSRMPDPAGTSDRKTQRKEALSSLLEGPDGVSLGGILDLARRASESAKATVRQVRDGSASLPRQAGDR